MSDRELIEDLLSALEYHTEQTRPIQFSKVAIEAAREYLRKPEQPAQQQEPVAWANPNDLQNFDMKVRTNGGPLHTVPLYTTPYVATPRPQRKPLTDEQKLNLVTNWFAEDWAIKKALGLLHDYDIEAAHGIKEKNT